MSIMPILTQKKLPREYETETVGDSGNTEHTNLSALGMKGLKLELPFITNCKFKKGLNQ